MEVMAEEEENDDDDDDDVAVSFLRPCQTDHNKQNRMKRTRCSNRKENEEV